MELRLNGRLRGVCVQVKEPLWKLIIFQKRAKQLTKDESREHFL